MKAIFKLRRVARISMLAIIFLSASLPVLSQEMTPDLYSHLRFRYIGPPGNRTAAVVGVPGDIQTYYIGTSSGGIFKSEDAGLNWRPVFDDQPVQSIGALAIAPSDHSIVWAGTGEAFVRSNISIGNGVYKSTDAGKTWQHMGLDLTGRIGREVIDPQNPDVVFVAAMGHCYGPQQERGVYRTRDGGETWERVLFVDENTGCFEIAMDPSNPRVLLAGMWPIEIHTYGRESGGPGGGIWMSRDEGTTWKRLDHNGLPDPPVGKIGLAWSQSNPKIVYALIETGAPNRGVLWRSNDGGFNWRLISKDRLLNERPHYASRIMVNPADEKEVYFAANSHSISYDGGVTTERSGWSGDTHDMWADPLIPDRMMISDDGGAMITLNRGKSWKSITGNLPDSLLIWRFVQDHIDPDLCFIGTEFGIYFTTDGGAKWIKFKGGLPTIPFRDLAIQRRENDLIGASFGRSFYVLDNYSFLRDVSEAQLKEEATLFDTKDTWRYIPRIGKGAQGAATFVAENPPFGAVFTYYLSEGYQTTKSKRQEIEKEKIKNNEEVRFPGWDAVEKERIQSAPKIWLTVRDESGDIIRKLPGMISKGFHRIAWDLRYPEKRSIDASRKINKRDFKRSGMEMVQPGIYSVALSKEIDGVLSPLSEPSSFKVIPLRKGALQGVDAAEIVAFWKKLNNIDGEISLYSIKLNKALRLVDAMELALARSTSMSGKMESELHQLKFDLLAIDRRMNGNQSKNTIGEKNNPTVSTRLSAAYTGAANSTYGPTTTQIRSLELAGQELNEIKDALIAITEQRIPEMQKKLQAAGAPVVE